MSFVLLSAKHSSILKCYHVYTFSFFCRKFVNFALVATMYSALCVYVVFVASSIKQVSYVGFYDNKINQFVG